MVPNVIPGRLWDKKFSLAATARNVVVSSGPRSGWVLPSLPSASVSPLADARACGRDLRLRDPMLWPRLLRGAGPLRLRALGNVLFRIWRSSFRSASTPNICVLISNFSFQMLNQPLTVFTGRLDSDVITVYRSTDPHVSSELNDVLSSPLCKPNLLQESCQLPLPVLSCVTGAIHRLFLSIPHC